MKTIGEITRNSAKKYGKKTALICKDKTFSYAELEILSNKLGNSLKRRGILKGDRVSIYSQNSWEWLIAYYATAKIGAVINPVNVMLTPDEVLYVVNDCGSKVIMTSPDKAEAVVGLLEKAETLKQVIVYGDESPSSGVPYNRLLEEGGDELTIEQRDPLDPSTIGYTSGTTGHPKGAVLTHRGVLINSKLSANFHMKDPQDIVLSALPTAHVYGNVVMNGTFLTGGTLVLLERFNEEVVFDAINAHKVTMFEGVPSMYMMLLSHSGINQCKFEFFRKCTVGGQTISTKVEEAVEERFGCPLLELWGMTEISGLGTTHPLLGENRHGSIGIPLPYCEVRIVDSEDLKTVLGPDQPGELMIKGPILMREYYGKEKATRETMESDGWLHTGDIAQMDKDGYVYVVDRLKDMILTAGYNVYPAEIERVLMQHPGVAMTAVGAVKDEVKGELAKAYIILHKNVQCTEEEIIAHCKKNLAAYKVPRQVKFVKELPQTSTGKLMRRELHKLDEK